MSHKEMIHVALCLALIYVQGIIDT